MRWVPKDHPVLKVLLVVMVDLENAENVAWSVPKVHQVDRAIQDQRARKETMEN